jgi:hypothetical protein
VRGEPEGEVEDPPQAESSTKNTIAIACFHIENNRD